MHVNLITGGNQDYIDLEAESARECAELVCVATSQFIDKDKVLIFPDTYMGTIKLRVYVSDPRPHDPAVNVAHDAEP